jgi:hypothetical protein
MDPDTVEKLSQFEALLPPVLVAVWRVGVIMALFVAAIRLGQMLERVARLEAAREYLIRADEKRDERVTNIEIGMGDIRRDVAGIAKALERIEARLEKLAI